MDASEVTEVCRLCPATAANQELLKVFDERFSEKNNIKEVILVTTGIEILENDLVSKKICQRCCNITLKMFKFRQDALKQDRVLKERCSQILGDRGIRLPNTCITIKQERGESFSSVKHEPIENKPATNKLELKERLHSSIKQIYQSYPHLKLPKSCVDRHMAPVVALPMGDVEKYFQRNKLDMRQFIYKSRTKPNSKIKSNSIAKKRTTVPTKKTVAPLKISKKLFGNSTQVRGSHDSYVCTPVSKQKNGRKRSVSSSDTEKAIKMPKGNEKSISIVKPAEVPTTDIVKTNEARQETEHITTTTTTRKQDRTTETKETLEESDEPSRSATPFEEHSEESRDSETTNISARTNSSNKKPPDFLESFGLTPTVTTTKSQPLLICNLCGSVHNNAFELKRHSVKHMVCPFCKLRFKSLEAKKEHIDNNCEVKKIMNSSQPTVKLEQIHLNLEIRKKYKETFKAFELIPGLQEIEPVEEVIVRAASPPPPVTQDNIIVLSDEDEAPVDPLSGIPIPTPLIPPPHVDNIVYNTVSIVRPDVRIKNDSILNQLSASVNEKKLLKELITLLKSQKKGFVEKMLHTNLPANKDIKINNAEGICEFKNLKEQLLTYKVPIHVSNGSFHVGYQFKSKVNSQSMSGQWDNIPLVDERKNSTANSHQNLSSNNNNTAPSATTVTCNVPARLSNRNSQTPAFLVGAPSLGVSNDKNSVTVSAAPTVLNHYIQVPISQQSVDQASLGHPNQVSKTQAITVISNSATPLLQNFALSVTSSAPALKPLPIPKAYINSAISRNISQPLNNSSGYRPIGPDKRSYSRHSLPPSFSNSNSLSTAKYSISQSVINSLGISPGQNRYQPKYVASNQSVSTSTSVTHNMPQQCSNFPTPKTGLNSGSNIGNNCELSSKPVSTSVSSVQHDSSNLSSSASGDNTGFKTNSNEGSKFRVKNVWELR